MAAGGLIIKTFERVPTGIKGLDILLGGGFLRGGIYLVMGTPGTGKTILANQFGFNHVSGKGRALYVSLLSESHSRLFGHLKPMRFFKEERISDAFNFVSAYHVLEKEGLDGLLKTLAQTVRQYKANLLFIDGVASAEDLSKSAVSFKKFVHDLNTVLSTSGCTAVLLSSLQGHLSHPEHTMVDGIVSLSLVNDGMSAYREIAVTKLRGSAHLQGRHYFRITNDGITVFPRIESYLGRTALCFEAETRLLPMGKPSLDNMFGGGIPQASVTSLVGSAGTGKTMMGCQFLNAGAANGEQGLYFGFYETPYRLQRRAAAVKMPLERFVKHGKIEVLWQSPADGFIDEFADRLLQAVDAKKVKRLFLDGMEGLLTSAKNHSSRLNAALGALMIELRNREVTVFFTEETKLFSSEISAPVTDQSAITDNVVFLKHEAINGVMTRLLSVIKTREAAPNNRVHRFFVTPEGIEVDGVIGAPMEDSAPKLAPRAKKKKPGRKS